MVEVRLLADMNVSPDTVAGLRSAGYDIVRVSDLLSPQAPDPLILELAGRENRVVLSHDLDFSVLLALQDRARPSLITLRLRTSDPSETCDRLLAVLPTIEHALTRGAAVTVDEINVRVRPLPIE